jgi:hypothetical protein
MTGRKACSTLARPRQAVGVVISTRSVRSQHKWNQRRLNARLVPQIRRGQVCCQQPFLAAQLDPQRRERQNEQQKGNQSAPEHHTPEDHQQHTAVDRMTDVAIRPVIDNCMAFLQHGAGTPKGAERGACPQGNEKAGRRDHNSNDTERRCVRPESSGEQPHVLPIRGQEQAHDEGPQPREADASSPFDGSLRPKCSD